MSTDIDDEIEPECMSGGGWNSEAAEPEDEEAAEASNDEEDEKTGILCTVAIGIVPISFAEVGCCGGAVRMASPNRES